jgi:hypothetical protein
MRLAPRDVSDHIFPRQNDHGPSYRRHGRDRDVSKSTFARFLALSDFRFLPTKSTLSRYHQQRARRPLEAAGVNRTSQLRPRLARFSRRLVFYAGRRSRRILNARSAPNRAAKRLRITSIMHLRPRTSSRFVRPLARSHISTTSQTLQKNLELNEGAFIELLQPVQSTQTSRVF